MGQSKTKEENCLAKLYFSLCQVHRKKFATSWLAIKSREDILIATSILTVSIHTPHTPPHTILEAISEFCE